ncbi:uncharacterized protein LOC142583749 [Dermacentor variabilis]|uniref:uncharacterized protein LOC142583749 n=1 Tax=Dermacentor variabilis TaxID=34621 RepID=UPI003F5BDF44
MVALLLHYNARDTFDILSSTDLPQLWGKELKAGVKDKYAPRKIVDLPCSTKIIVDMDKITKKDVYPLPRTYDALDALCNSKHFSSMDLKYLCQIQAQMGILEVEMADFFVFQESENVLLLTANFDTDF